ncbi:MAG: ATP-binding cassette domain-containing protein [Mycoplasmoidaceae bacterium]
MEQLQQNTHNNHLLELILKELNIKHINSKQLEVFYHSSLNQYNVKKTFQNINIKLTNAKLKSLFGNKKQICLVYLDINYQKEFGLLKKVEEKYLLFLNNQKISLSWDQLNNLKIINIWELTKHEFNPIYFEADHDFHRVKYKYNLISFFISIFTFAILLLSNLYLKIIISDIIPNSIIQEFIFISIFFLIIYLLNILSEGLLKIYKQKNLNYLTINFFNKFYDELLNKSNDELLRMTDDSILTKIKSLAMVIEQKIFVIPDFVANLFIIITTTIILALTSYLFIFICLLSFLFNFLIVYLKREHLKLIRNKNFQKEALIETNVFDYIRSIKEEWNYSLFKQKKESLMSSIYDYQSFSKNNLYHLEKIEMLYQFGLKIFFIIFAVVAVFLSINQQANDFSIGIMIYCFSLINIINSSAHTISCFFANLFIYKIHKQELDNFYNNIYQTKGKVLFPKKVKEIKFIKFNKKFNDHIVFNNYDQALKNDCVIYGKNGIGKTTLLKAIIPNAFSEGVFINNIAMKMYELDDLKHNIIYLNSFGKTLNLDVNKLLYFNPNKTEIIIAFLKQHQLFEIINNEKRSAGEHQIINFLNIIHEKNKIILFDEPLANVSLNLKIEILKIFKKDLVENNFLIYVSHDKKILKQFKSRLELK